MVDFTPTKISEIISLRRSGATQRELSKRFYCSAQTIGQVLRQNGIAGYHARKPHFPVAMIQHDWNAGVSSEQIASKYGLCRDSLYNLASHYRKRGWRFDVRSNRKATD